MDLELGRFDDIWVSIAHSISGIFRQSASIICLLLIASNMWPGYLVSVGPSYQASPTDANRKDLYDHSYLLQEIYPEKLFARR